MEGEGALGWLVLSSVFLRQRIRELSSKLLLFLKDAGKAGQGSRLVNVAAGAEREELTTGPESKALGKS